MDYSYRPPTTPALVDPGRNGDWVTNNYAFAKNQQIIFNYNLALDKKLYDIEYQKLLDQKTILTQQANAFSAQAIYHEQSLFLLHVVAFGVSFVAGMSIWRLVCYAKGQKNFW